MAENQTIDVSQIVENRKFDSFNVKIIVMSFFVTLFDGYDLTVAGYAAPSLIKAWSIGNFAAFGPVFSASLFGILFGAPIYGYIGDRFGRNRAIVLSCLNFGAFTWFAAWASGLDQLMVLRFLAGIGIGGLLPNIIALNIELNPMRYRTTAVVVAFTGVAGGAGIPGLVSAFFVPSYGWPILFHVGGILPIVIAIAVLLWLPESIRFLTLKEGRQADVRRLLIRLVPTLTVGPDAKFILQDEKTYERHSVKYLFTDGLAAITLIIWLLYAADLMAQYFLNSWMPTLLTNAQMSVGRAAIVTSVMQGGGVVGGLLLMRPVDRIGMLPITLLFALGIPSVGVIGFIGDYPNLLTVAAFLVGASAVGGLLSVHSIAASFYPTSVRSSGMGWALGIGRFGAVLGPLVGGLLIYLKLTMQQLFLVAMVPFILVTIASYFLSRMYAAKLGPRGKSTARA